MRSTKSSRSGRSIQQTIRDRIIAIDGPSGAGKSTVAKCLADVLGGALLDTGGMYRSVAHQCLEQGIVHSQQISRVARQLQFDINTEKKTLLVNSMELGRTLRSEEVGLRASQISALRLVRKALTTRQQQLARKWARHFPVVVEGRDIGTVVFPKARFKFFVTASPEVRAKRRMEQLKLHGVRGLTLKQVMMQNEARDLQDSTRRIAPLKVADDAVVVDTSTMAIAQVVQFMRDHIQGSLSLDKSLGR